MRLLYLSGSGRSGSTMFERVLHSSPDTAALGEFHCLWRLSKEQIACSCGEAISNDPFWRSVLAEAGTGPADIAELRRLEHRLSRSGFVASRGFNLDRLKDDPEVKCFLAIQFAIFEAASRIAAKPLIIDSSKAGPRAWILACDDRTRFVHLYRNPENVIASWRSRKFDKGLGTEMQRLSVSRAAIDWIKAEFSARLLAKQRPVVMLDYEKLCLFPRPEVEATLATLGLEDLEEIEWLDNHTVQPGSDYHSINGNPDRFDQGPLRISARRTDWSKHSFLDRVSGRFVGRALSMVFRSVKQKPF